MTQAWSPISDVTSHGGAAKSTFDDPTLLEIAGQHGKSVSQVMLRWHLQERPLRDPQIDEVGPNRRALRRLRRLRLELAGEQVAAIDALDTGVSGGPDADSVTLETYGMPIPEASSPRTGPPQGGLA